MKTIVYTAAGGNPTALNIGDELRREDYAAINHRIQELDKSVEQVGFFEMQEGVPRLQMAGGEFCGNATRSFACLLKDIDPSQNKFTFQVSGFPKLVTAKVKVIDDRKYYCEASFSPFVAKINQVDANGVTCQVVDLGGIVHIVVNEAEIPFRDDSYESEMKRIKNLLGIDRPAVGVLWVSKSNGSISMKPVVWVRDIDTCYYETSCGSGSIAVGMVNGGNADVIQPSGKTISVKCNGEQLLLSSEMERVMEIEEV